jgi:hypothetical protein
LEAGVPKIGENIMEGMIRSTWENWISADKCPLCQREGKDIANVWKKGHCRADGIILETGLAYCKECVDTEAAEEHWKKWWVEQWKEEEKRCEENWAKDGVYTNVGGYFHIPSFYFGYAKTADGLKPYLEVYPDCPRYKLERELMAVRRQFRKTDPDECKKKMVELVESANPEHKDEIIASINSFFEVIKRW